VNVAVGAVAFLLATRLVPTLPPHVHPFDLIRDALRGAGMFPVVFRIQEGQTYGWGTIAGPISVWTLIAAGLVLLVAFVFWQLRNSGEPLLPMGLFRDRNFSLANLAITTVRFTVTAMSVPLM